MGFVDDDEVRARVDEVAAPLAGLHVVQADHRVRMHREDAHAGRNATLQAPGAAGGYRDGADIETNLQFGDPLVHEMRRAQDDGAFDIAAV